MVGGFAGSHRAHHHKLVGLGLTAPGAPRLGAAVAPGAELGALPEAGADAGAGAGATVTAEASWAWGVVAWLWSCRAAFTAWLGEANAMGMRKSVPFGLGSLRMILPDVIRRPKPSWCANA